MKRGNIYYYTFYLYAMFFKRAKPSDNDFAFTSIILLSLLFLLNIFTLVFPFVELHLNKSQVYLMSLALYVPIVAVNYALLKKGNKDVAILEYYRNVTNQKSQTLKKVIVISYAIVSLAACIYMASTR